MKKIALIGAGSLIFTRNLTRDLLSFPAFSDSEIVLMDINKEKLSYIEHIVKKIVEAGGYNAAVTATNDRAQALDGADGVLVTVLANGVDVWRHDIEIPRDYGVDICVGDTLGPSGIFRYLRTAPLMLDICHDVEKYCPNAIVLNYTNPMSMLCRTVQSMTKANITGLCHSVQGTAMMLSRWLGADFERDVAFLCAGINHQAFFLEYKVNGKDVYPELKEIVKRPEIYEEEIVRNEMLLHLDYYVTESSRHNSEYTAWFRKRPDLIEKYCAHGAYKELGENASTLKNYIRRGSLWTNEYEKAISEKVDLSRGHEYAAYILNAVIGDNTIFEFNGNVRNFGLIENLPWGCCVEVPVVASKNGLRPIHVGTLPYQLAILVNTNAQCEELAIKGFLEADRRKILQAVLFDPLTSAVLSMREIESMVDRMFRQNKEFLSYIY